MTDRALFIGRSLQTVAVVMVAAVLLASPALWNGFPLLYWDSYDYMGVPFGAKMPMFRAASYVVITVFGALAGSLWVPVAIQCVMIAWFLHEALEVFLPWPARWTLIPATAGLAALTALPWFASQLMADCFTGPLVLGVAALAFGGERLNRWRRVAMAVGLGVAVTVHTSHVALVGGLLIVFGVLRLLATRGVLNWMTPRLPLPLLSFVLGISLAASANWAVTGQVFISQSTDILMLARLVQDGIAKRYLAVACAEGKPFRLCPYLAELPDNANQFLWTPGPFYKLGGWSPEMQKEARSILIGSLFAFPLDHLASAWELSREQFLQVQTGDGVVKLDTIHADGDVAKDPFMPKVIGRYYQEDLPEYWESRQRQNIDFGVINTWHVPLAYGGYVAVFAAFVLGWRRRDRVSTGLALTVILALLGNAFICGALSNPNKRYQARIAWTAIFATAVAGARVRTRDEVRCIGQDMPL